MQDRVFDEVTERVFDRVAIPGNDYSSVKTVEDDSSFLRESPGRHRCDRVRRDLIQVYLVRCVYGDAVQPGDTQQLINEPVHAGYIGLQFCKLAVPFHDVERASNDGKGRTQFVRGVRGELSLKSKALLKTIERSIHR